MSKKSAILDKVKAYHASFTYDMLKLAICESIEATGNSAVVFAPHHDDETFGCGGLIALKRRLKAPVKVVILTDGARSHDGVGTLESATLVEMRRKEAIKAAGILGVDSADVIFLNNPDQGLGRLPEITREQTIGHIARLLEGFPAPEVYVPHRRDRHPDHEAAYMLVTAAIQQSKRSFEVFQYPVWMMWGSRLGTRLAFSDLSSAKILRIGDVHERKLQAISAYQSQLETLPPGFLMQSLKQYEIFFTPRPQHVS